MKSRQLRGAKSPKSIAPRGPFRQTSAPLPKREPSPKQHSRARPPQTLAPQPAPGGSVADGPAQPLVASDGVRLIEVPEDRAGQRLDNFLIALLKGVPRSHIYRLLRTGQVRVDGRRARADHRVAPGECLRIPPLRIPDGPVVLRASDRALLALSERILFEDRRFLALDKPSGLASHGGSGIALGAIERLRQLRPGVTLELVHRLDRETSGVLLVAKKRAALLAAQAAIREGRARKRYLALLVGHLPRAVVRVDAPLEKSLLRGGERMVEVSAAGKLARSEFRRIERYPKYDFVEVRIDTGRTHQVRVHARHIGLPLAGDAKYGDAEANAHLRRLGLRRLFLHSAELSLDLGAQDDVTFEAPLPDELAGVLRALAKNGDRVGQR